jgi:PAS domain S-box-containing protein
MKPKFGRPGVAGIEARKFQMVADKASDQAIIADPGGTIIYANRSAEKHTGYSRQELIGQNIADLRFWGGWMGKYFYRELWQAVKRKKRKFTGEILNRRQNGTKYLTRIEVYPLTDMRGKLRYMVGLEQDITTAKEIDRTRAEFIALASHQLRTPLNNISLSLEVLLHDPANRLSLTQKDCLKGIYDDVHGMADLISTLLDASRIQLGSFLIELRPVNVIDTAENALKELSGDIYSKNLKLIKEYDGALPIIMSDQNIIKTILHNLLTNAVKYTPEKGSITFKISRSTSKVFFRVSDSGYGIPDGEQSRVFTKYFRARNIKNRNAVGTGLGLYLTKLLIRSVQGKIEFSSRENEGTTFTVSLPLNEYEPKERENQRTLQLSFKPN